MFLVLDVLVFCVSEWSFCLWDVCGAIKLCHWNESHWKKPCCWHKAKISSSGLKLISTGTAQQVQRGLVVGWEQRSFYGTMFQFQSSMRGLIKTVNRGDYFKNFERILVCVLLNKCGLVNFPCSCKNHVLFLMCLLSMLPLLQTVFTY